MARKPIKRKYTAPKQRKKVSDKDYDTYVKQYDAMNKANKMKTDKKTKKEYLMFKANVERNLNVSGDIELQAKARKNMARYIASLQKAWQPGQLETFKNSFDTLKEQILAKPKNQRTPDEIAFLNEKSIEKKMKQGGTDYLYNISETYDSLLRRYGFKTSDDDFLSEFAMAGS
jgi:hypothetical protein